MPRDLTLVWERRMEEWMVWDQGRGASISCAYQDRIPTGRKPTGQDECLATDRALSLLRAHGREGKRWHEAILTYTRNTGTRASQAARLGIHPDTYRARVNAARVLLELILRNRPIRKARHAQATNPAAKSRNARNVNA